MFKRSNKITSLLVAAAAVVSLVPAGVSATEVKKIESQDGTVYTAASFKNGSYYIDGEDINGNSNSAVYYVSPDGEYKELEDITSGSTAYNFATIYTNVDEGDYAVDMTNGTVLDTNIREDIVDDAGEALRKEIKKDTEDRYADANKARTYVDGNIIRKSGNYFLTKYTAAQGVNTPNNAGKLNVYCGKDGKYIDADYNLGKIKVNTTGASGSITIENTEDYEKDSKGFEVKASLSDISFIDHDLDSVYRFATITIDSESPVTEINGRSVAANVFNDVNGDKTKISYRVIQKISKAAAFNKIDGANYAKTVTNYTISNKDGETLDGLDGTGVIDNTKGYSYYIMNGKFSVYDTKTTSGEVKIRTYDLKSSNGYYYIDEGDTSTEDCEVHGTTAAVKGAGGILYRLDGGYLYTYNNNGDWDKFYKVDGAFDQFEVENKDNMILWNQEDGVYSVISTPAATPVSATATTTGTTTPAVTAGWVQAENGTWTYNKTDGVKATGWIKDGSTWYFLNGSGVMKTGWINDNGTWYYCNSSGAMLFNTTVDGYVLGATGAWSK